MLLQTHFYLRSIFHFFFPSNFPFYFLLNFSGIIHNLNFYIEEENKYNKFEVTYKIIY